MTEKAITRFEVRATDELKADAAWAAGRHEQPTSLWIKSLIVAAVRKERALEARELRGTQSRRRRKSARILREIRRDK